MLRGSPTRTWSRLRIPRLPEAVTQSELKLICETLRENYEAKRDRGLVQEGEMIWQIPLFKFALYTGMRASELGDFDGGTSTSRGNSSPSESRRIRRSRPSPSTPRRERC